MSRKKGMAPSRGKGDFGMGFKLFLSDLAVLLPPESIDSLASCLEFSKLTREKLDTSGHPVHSMIECLRENDIITSNSILKLTKALDSLEETTIRNKITSSFQKWTSMFPEEQPPKKLSDKSEPRKVLEAVKRIQEPKIETKATPEPRKVLEAVRRISNSEKELEKKQEPRKVLEAAKRINDAEQSAGSKSEIGKVMEAVKRMNAPHRKDRITTEDGKVTDEVNRIVDSAKAERRARLQRRISEAINPGLVSKRLEEDYIKEFQLSPADREHFENFLNHAGLNLVNQLTIKDGIRLISRANGGPEDMVSSFFIQLRSGDPLATEKLSSTYTYQQGYAKSVCNICKRDALFAILTCCDMFMLQDVLSKLHNCGRAVPMVLPTPSSTKLTFCLWGLRKCMQTTCTNEALNPMTVYFCTHPFITISALRFGVVKFSKSHILNRLLADLKSNEDLRDFLSREEDPERCMWSKGTVEVTWGFQGNGKDRQDALPSFSLLNLRGDGLFHSRQVKLCSDVSNIIIVFLSLRLKGKYIQEINQMAVSSRVIVVLDCSERNGIDLSTSEKVSILFCEGLTSQAIGERLKICLLDIIQSKEGRLLSTKTFEDYAKDCSLFNIEVDEDSFKEAKVLAGKIGSTISSSIDQTKSRIFPSQKSLNIEDSSTEDSNCKETPRGDSKSLLSYTLKTFLKGLSLDGIEKHIFLSLLNIILDEKSCSAMGPSLQEYKNHVRELRKHDIHNYITESNRKEKSHHNVLNVNEISSIEEAIKQNVINVDQFLFELWPLAHCSHPSVANDFPIDTLFNIQASWIMKGNSIDIFRSYPSHSAATWAQGVLKGLQSTLDLESQVLVVAAIGDMSGSKSRLLKHFFGVNAIQSEIMMSNGVRIYLFSIKNTDNKPVGFDFILLVDIENVKLSEIIGKDLIERRKRICALVSPITDLLIVNIDNDSTEMEKSALFDIVVRGMLTNSTCQDTIRCFVVYHVTPSTSDIDVNTLEQITLNKIKDSCSNVNKVERADNTDDTLVKNELYDTVCKKLSSGTPDEGSKLNVKILSSWNGKISSNAESLQNLQEYMLQILTENKHHSKTLSEISENICTGSLETVSLNEITCDDAPED